MRLNGGKIGHGPRTQVALELDLKVEHPTNDGSAIKPHGDAEHHALGLGQIDADHLKAVLALMALEDLARDITPMIAQSQEQHAIAEPEGHRDLAMPHQQRAAIVTNERRRRPARDLPTTGAPRRVLARDAIRPQALHQRPAEHLDLPMGMRPQDVRHRQEGRREHLLVPDAQRRDEEVDMPHRKQSRPLEGGGRRHRPHRREVGVGRPHARGRPSPGPVEGLVDDMQVAADQLVGDAIEDDGRGRPDGNSRRRKGILRLRLRLRLRRRHRRTGRLQGAVLPGLVDPEEFPEELVGLLGLGLRHDPAHLFPVQEPDGRLLAALRKVEETLVLKQPNQGRISRPRNRATVAQLLPNPLDDVRSRIKAQDIAEEREVLDLPGDDLADVSGTVEGETLADIDVDDPGLAVDQQQAPPVMMEDGRAGIGRHAMAMGGVGHDASFRVPSAALTPRESACQGIVTEIHSRKQRFQPKRGPKRANRRHKKKPGLA